MYTIYAEWERAVWAKEVDSEDSEILGLRDEQSGSDDGMLLLADWGDAMRRIRWRESGTCTERTGELGGMYELIRECLRMEVMREPETG